MRSGETYVLILAVITGAATAAFAYRRWRASSHALKNGTSGAHETRRHAPRGTDFQSFLRDNTKIRSQSSQSDAIPAARSGDTERNERLPLIALLYGTATGFSRETAEELNRRLQSRLDLHHGAAAAEMGEIALWDMREYPDGIPGMHLLPFVCIVCSTQGDGVPPPDASEFVEWLDGDRAQRLCGVSYTVAALGDRSYPHFCRCGRLLDERMGALGARRVVDRVEVDGEDLQSIDRWMQEVERILFGATPDDKSNTDGRLIDDCVRIQKEHEAEYANILQSVAPRSASKTVSSRENPFLVRVVRRANLCKPQNLRYAECTTGASDLEEKATFSVHLSTDVGGPAREFGPVPLDYAPGDSIGIYAPNCDNEVDDLIEALQVDRRMTIARPKSFLAATAAVRGHVATGHDDGDAVAIEMCLRYCYDVKTPRQSMWAHLRGALGQCACPADGVAGSAGKLRALDSVLAGGLDPSGNESLRHILRHNFIADILRRFACSTCLLKNNRGDARCAPDAEDVTDERISASSVLRHMRALAPRLYSISSSPLEDPFGCQITVAVVKYQNEAGKRRRGVASSFVSERIRVGECCAAFIERNKDFRLPQPLLDGGDPQNPLPLVMIGPGTGLAPFRAFIMHQKLSGVSQQFANHLFFGCRHQHHDFLYDRLLRELHSEGTIRLRTAFSRDQPERRYVQTLLWEDRDLVWKTVIRGGRGIVYVCGDGSAMAHDVNEVLVDIIQWGMKAECEAGPGDVSVGHDRERAASLLEAMAKEGRYKRDVWVS